MRVVFLKNIDLPSTLESSAILGEGILTITSNDTEISVRKKCIQLLQTVLNSSELALDSISPNDLKFVSCCHRKLTYPIVPPTFQYTLGGIKAVIGQGKLYIKTPVNDKVSLISDDIVNFNIYILFDDNVF